MKSDLAAAIVFAWLAMVMALSGAVIAAMVWKSVAQLGAASHVEGLK